MTGYSAADAGQVGVAKAKAADVGAAAVPSQALALAATASAPSVGTRCRTRWVNVVSI